MKDILTMIEESTDAIKKVSDIKPDIAIILGSGLGPLANEVEDAITISYNDIPNFPMSTIPGHEGKLVIGKISNKNVIIMKGRFHYYEGHPMEIVTLPVRVFAKLGIKNLFVTNASGGIGKDLSPGSLMLINDHISFQSPSPLRGPNLEEFGPRFQDMTEIYTKSLIKIAKEAANKLDITVHEGVYAYSRGPMFETPAEIRALSVMGADAVGMSTVPEAIVARHCNMSTLGISLVTNKAAGLSGQELSHMEVMDTAAAAEKNFVKLAKEIIADWEV